MQLRQLLLDPRSIIQNFIESHPEGPNPANLREVEMIIRDALVLESRVTDSERTSEGMVPKILSEISNTVQISGVHDFDTGTGKITQEYAENPAFAAAVKTVVEAVLKVFPPQGTVQLHKDILAFNKKHLGDAAPKPAFKLFQGGIDEEETETADQPLLH